MRFVLLLFFCLLNALLLAQTAGGLRIASLEFEGLKRTKQSHAARFLGSEVGDSLDLAQLHRDVQQLRNITAFANAEFQLDTTAEGIAVTLELTENFTLFPIVNFGGVTDNFWYQVGATDANWLGRGLHLTTFYMNNNGRSN